jgi:hypothetical protein
MFSDKICDMYKNNLLYFAMKIVSSKFLRNKERKWNFKRDVWEADDAVSEAAGNVIKCLKQTAEIMYFRISNSPKNVIPASHVAPILKMNNIFLV